MIQMRWGLPGRHVRSGLGVCAVLLLLAACASVPPPGPGWHPHALPGKESTTYRWTLKDGLGAWHAVAHRSASLMRRHLPADLSRPNQVAFSWWVDELIAAADIRHPESDDAPARVIFAFDGDRSKLSMRNRMLSEMAHALTGEPMPYATLVYAWDGRAPVDEVVISQRSDRVRTLVVESGQRHLKQWRHYQRDLAADFRRAFGEEPGPLLGMAVMTDADNTASQAEAWYGDIQLR
jgi:Protein of unknown function (DUF3047)